MIGNDKLINKDYDPFNSEVKTRKLTKEELKKYDKCKGDDTPIAKQYEINKQIT